MLFYDFLFMNFFFLFEKEPMRISRACPLKFVVPRQSFTEIGRLRTNENIVFFQNLILRELLIGVPVRLVYQVTSFRFGVIEIGGNYPVFYLKEI